jgi:catechol 2,3-dioxygenase-like lactoylglutathione lyase family enzyme
MNRIKTILTNPALRLRTIGTALFPIFFVLPAPVALAAEANLTRFGPEVYELVQGKPTTYSARFKAVDGPAQLVLQDEGIENAWIEVNGNSVVERQHFSGNGEVVIALNLQQENTIEVTVPGMPTGELGVRVTQVSEAELGLLRQGYFGLNTSNMERQRAFYETLGFIGEIYPAGPETSTTFAQSLGFPEDYLIYVSLHSLEDPPTQPFVDTVEFRGNSFREEPPYASLNHIGMAYATYSTPDLDGDIAYLKSRGVEFLSEPATAPNGERFVFMKDQDGIFLKLIHTDEGGEPTPGPDLVRLVNTNMNVSDLERSREFYRLIGFTVSEPASQAGSGEFSAAHGFDGPIEFEGVDVSLGEGTDGATLQLRQWKTPYDDTPAYPPPVNHLGIDRINFYVENLTATIKAMNDLGYEQLGPIGGGAGGGIVFFFDPDGIKVQFAGPRTD